MYLHKQLIRDNRGGMRVSQLEDETCARAHQNRVRATLERDLNADAEHRPSHCLEVIGYDYNKVYYYLFWFTKFKIKKNAIARKK